MVEVPLAPYPVAVWLPSRCCRLGHGRKEKPGARSFADRNQGVKPQSAQAVTMSR